jgi:hypothetical protein
MTADQMAHPGVNSPCPVCGAYSLAPAGEMSALLAVCNVLVLKALEKLGSFIVRVERRRHNLMDSRPYYVAHTLWQPTDATVDKALKGAWEVVPALLVTHGCCDITSVQVSTMLDDYVHDLAITGTPHTLEELQYRFTNRLGLPVYWKHPAPHEIALPEELIRQSAARQDLPEELRAQDLRPVDSVPDYIAPDAGRPARVPDRVLGARRENGQA